MFREMRRKNQLVSLEECQKVLQEEKRAAYSVIGEDGYPYTVPINFYYDAEENCIYFHGAKAGHKVDAIRACDKVCFTVWNQGFKKEGHWEWNSTSVVVFGRVEEVQDMQEARKQLRHLANKYYPSVEEVEMEMASPAASRVALYRITMDHMTGKLVNEK